jgi:hypothetical protein
LFSRFCLEYIAWNLDDGCCQNCTQDFFLISKRFIFIILFSLICTLDNSVSNDKHAYTHISSMLELLLRYEYWGTTLPWVLRLCGTRKKESTSIIIFCYSSFVQRTVSTIPSFLVHSPYINFESYSNHKMIIQIRTYSTIVTLSPPIVFHSLSLVTNLVPNFSTYSYFG